MVIYLQIYDFYQILKCTKMRSSSFPEIPVSPSIRHRTDFENIWSTTTDEWMSWVWTSGWPLSCPDRLQGEEHLVPHLLTYADDGFLQELIGSSLLIEDLPCARHNGSSRLEIFLLHLQPLSSFFATKNKQTKKNKNLPGHIFLFVFVDRLRLRGRKVLSLEILRDVMSTSGVLHCQFAFSEWVISMYLRSSQPCSLLHILYAQWVFVNWFGTSMWQHKYIMKNEESEHPKC